LDRALVFWFFESDKSSVRPTYSSMFVQPEKWKKEKGDGND
jgi:hypothetical protein